MPSRNEEYYLEDTVFQVEDQLFKVHRRSFVKESPVFRDMYALPVAEVDGMSDGRPLVLEGIEKREFIQLLRCLYPLQFGDRNLEFSVEEWRSVLKLASLYEMAEVKAFVIEKMTPLLTGFPSLQINLAKRYNIRTWLAPGLSRLACRTEPLSERDVELIGLTDSLKICTLRERRRRCEKCTGSCGERMHSGGFTLEEFGQAFGFSHSELPRLYERCVCPPLPARKEDPLPDLKKESSKKKGWSSGTRESATKCPEPERIYA